MPISSGCRAADGAVILGKRPPAVTGGPHLLPKGAVLGLNRSTADIAKAVVPGYLMDRSSLRKKIRDIRSASGIAWDVIEQDYVLSCVLFGLSHHKKLKSTLVFKGGTALKKCYFGNYRFSQDLDFTALENAPRGEELMASLKEATSFASLHAEDVDLYCKRYPETFSHLEGQEAFDIQARLPWQKNFNTTIKIEVKTREIVFLPPTRTPPHSRLWT